MSRYEWYARACGLCSDAVMQRIGLSIGAGGILAFEESIAVAKEDKTGPWVDVEFDVLAHRAFTTVAKVKQTVTVLIERDVLVEAEVRKSGFRARFARWDRYQGTKARVADRVAKHRKQASEGVTDAPETRAESVTEALQERYIDTASTVTTIDNRHKTELQNEKADAFSSPPNGDDTPKNPVPDEPPPRLDVHRLCHLLAYLLTENGVLAKDVKPDSKSWQDAARLMLDRDKRDVAECERLIRWCQNDSFWRANIRSMPTFRRQYDQLRMQADRGKPAAEQYKFSRPDLSIYDKAVGLA